MPLSDPPAKATLAQRIARGDTLVGGLLRLPNQYLTSVAGLGEFDFIAFDCEHGPSEIGVLLEHIVIAKANGLEVLVRIPAEEEHSILRVLDAGASGLILPRISTPDKAVAAVQSASYPPVGTRGFATYTPAGNYGLVSALDHLTASAARLVVIAMIEDAVGVDNAAQIAGTAGVSGTLVGPADLAVNLGHPGEVAHPEVLQSTQLVHDATRSAGAAVTVIVGSSAAAAKAMEQGAQIILYNVAVAINTMFADLLSVSPRSGE